MTAFTHDELLFISYFKTFPKSKLVRSLTKELNSLDGEEARKEEMILSILDKLKTMTEAELDGIDPIFDDYELDEELLPSWRESNDDDEDDIDDDWEANPSGLANTYSGG